MIKAVLIRCETPEELQRFLILEEQEYQATIQRIIYPSDHGEVAGKVFERMMNEKGYKVSSQRSKDKRCKLFNIGRVKRGKEWCYKKSDIERVPNRI